MVFTDNNFTPTTTTNTTSNSPPLTETDDISAFLRHILHRSSSNSSSSFSSSSGFLPSLPSTTGTASVGMHALDNNNTFLPNLSSTTPAPPLVFYGLDRVVADRSFPGSGRPNNEYNEDCDYESEEGAEATGEENEARRSHTRNQSKRTRAAEVHNLSEKRRRSRINEKMKALQKLIPNSNKTDKASMLDEAIEYLKQLQLQVQMLSMRNGMSLHPMCLPEEQAIMHSTQLSQIGNHINNGNTTFDHLSMTNSLNIVPETSHSTFNLANRHGSSTRPSLSSVSNVINSEAAPFGLDSRVQPSFRPFQTQNLDHRQTLCREQSLPEDQLCINKHEIKALGNTLPLSFGAEISRVEGHHNSLEAHASPKYGLQELVLDNILGQNQSTSCIFSGLHQASSSARSDKLTTGR